MSQLLRRLARLEANRKAPEIYDDEDFKILAQSGVTHEEGLAWLEKMDAIEKQEAGKQYAYA